MNNHTTSSVPVVEYTCGHTKVAVDEYYPCGACIGRVLMPACCVDLIAGATVALFRRPEHAKDFHSVVRDVMRDIYLADVIKNGEEADGEHAEQQDEAGQDGEVVCPPNSSPSPLPSPSPSPLDSGCMPTYCIDLIANKVVGFLYRPEYLERLRCVIRDVVFELHNAEKNGVDTKP
ncbi:uncharacterized protein F5891DRAFT_1186502 [Suillus fuscotomentosus]|uniref:Uncharacterized protein n=1 Tax=Suillus fuscotomentosus TaxID=1912939 RepID=A0AAD4EA01_9AGAM|nr:uncharacterized protein F5891DRAFT_1186502 [Suillus fuscotomentosus]KAG1902394.1 hypothetical protein F5891DRAFT_1186502 [Suillus fuscotomentosus]